MNREIKFRNYIYVYGSEYCDYIDEYEVAIDDRNDRIEELENNDIVYSRKACYGHGEYKIYKCPEEVTFNELALICDGGNLCFGGRGNKNFIEISED